MTKKYLEANFESLDEVQHWALATILEHGEESKPRGLSTLELFPAAFTLLNPRRRCVLNPIRKWSLPLALGEFCWHVSGSNELKFIEYYAPRWKDFTDDGATIRGSCYGHRVFKRDLSGSSQWERLVELLKFDPDTRRAVLQFADPKINLDGESKDVPCASTLQFFVRSSRVHAITNMRSNDAIWGLPYDVFLFTMLQELLACELGLELGTYSHFASSLHLYERHYELAKTIITSANDGYFEMPPMKEHSQLKLLLELEAKIRTGDVNTALQKRSLLNSYWGDLLTVLLSYKSRGTSSNLLPLFQENANSPYGSLLNRKEVNAALV